MEQTSRPAANSITLSTLPGKGLVRTCPSGCVHVTYGCVTLDFCRPQAFERLAELLDRHARQEKVAQFQYGHATLQFTPQQFEEFAGLVAAGREQLAQLAVVRHLLSGFPEA